MLHRYHTIIKVTNMIQMISITQGPYTLNANINLNNSNGDSISLINVVQEEIMYMKLKINHTKYKMET